jgi:hypothetical protein
MTVDFFEFNKEKYIFLGLVCVALSIFAHWWMDGHPIWMISAAAFWAIVFFTPLVIDLAPRILEARRARKLAALQGVNYMFGMSNIRVMYAQGLVWLATEDVYEALGLRFGKAEQRKLQADKRHRDVPGTEILGISETYLPDFVLSTRSSEALRFNLWFEREVLKPIRNKIAQGVHVPEAVE